MMKLSLMSLLLFCLFACFACSEKETCSEGDQKCVGQTVYTCNSTTGSWTRKTDCSEKETCEQSYRKVDVTTGKKEGPIAYCMQPNGVGSFCKGTGTFCSPDKSEVIECKEGEPAKLKKTCDKEKQEECKDVEDQGQCISPNATKEKCTEAKGFCSKNGEIWICSGAGANPTLYQKCKVDEGESCVEYPGAERIARCVKSTGEGALCTKKDIFYCSKGKKLVLSCDKIGGYALKLQTCKKDETCMDFRYYRDDVKIEKASCVNEKGEGIWCTKLGENCSPNRKHRLICDKAFDVKASYKEPCPEGTFCLQVPGTGGKFITQCQPN
jgi:hypothetical protein